jgi:hypothetical protein
MPECVLCGHTARYIGVHVQREHGMMPKDYAAQHGPLFDEDVTFGGGRSLGTGWSALRDAFDELDGPDRLAFVMAILEGSTLPRRMARVREDLLRMPYAELMTRARDVGIAIPVSGCQRCIVDAMICAMTERLGGPYAMRPTDE